MACHLSAIANALDGMSRERGPTLTRIEARFGSQGSSRLDALAVPDNLTLGLPAAHSPELNVIERGCIHLKERCLSHRVWPDENHILDAVCHASNRPIDETGRI